MYVDADCIFYLFFEDRLALQVEVVGMLTAFSLFAVLHPGMLGLGG